MIEEFRGEYRWLSNMYPYDVPMEYNGLTYRTNEHFYVAMKSTDRNVREYIANLESPGEAKRFGRDILIREDWDDIKDQVMLWGLIWKFSPQLSPYMAAKLLATGDQYIQEGNRWGDKYWGVCLDTGAGLNKLGKMLMQIREEIANE